MPRTKSPGHVTKHFNLQIYEAFAADLRNHNENGLSDGECDTSKQWLRDIAASATTIPDKDMPGKKIHERCEAVAGEYDQWNSRYGTQEIRDRFHYRIRRKIDKLERTYRHRTKLLEEKADPGIYRAFYEATEKLVRALPNTLSMVMKVFAKYPKPS